MVFCPHATGLSLCQVLEVSSLRRLISEERGHSSKKLYSMRCVIWSFWVMEVGKVLIKNIFYLISIGLK